jgi:hypothetical protein
VASEDIRDFLTALSVAGVEFVVVGAHALAAHGHVRATGDLDVLVRASRDNALELEEAILEFAGVSLQYFGVSVEELSTSRVGFYMGVEPDRIHVMTRIAGVRFERAWKGRLIAVIEGVAVPVLGFEDLIASKRASISKRTQVDRKPCRTKQTSLGSWPNESDAAELDSDPSSDRSPRRVTAREDGWIVARSFGRFGPVAWSQTTEQVAGMPSGEVPG